MAPPPPNAGDTPIYGRLQPLVGGPAFLPLHVQIAYNGTRYDFLPLDPTAPTTTSALLRGGSVEGEIRIASVPEESLSSRWQLIGYSGRPAADLRDFAEAQPTALSLRSNNCFTFGRALTEFLEGT